MKESVMPPGVEQEDRPWFRHYEPGVPREVLIRREAMPSLLETAGQRHPRGAGVILSSAHPKFHSTLTWARLDAEANRFANALIGLGIRPGDRVALQLNNIPQYVIAHYGVLKAGAVVVQVNPLYKGKDLQFVLKDSGARVLVTLSRLLRQVADVRADTHLEHVIATKLHDYFPFRFRLLYTLFREKKEGDAIPPDSGAIPFRDLMGRARPAPPGVAVDPEGLAVLQYTGGTTGFPKAAMLSHRNLMANVAQVRAWLTRITEGEDSFLVVVPMFHSYGLLAMNGAISLASTIVLVLQRLFDARSVAEAIRTFKPSVFPGVPAMYLAINNLKGVDRYDLRSVKACVSGAAALPGEVQERFQQLTGGRLVEGFGMSEASPLTHANPIWGADRIGSIGLPVPNTDAKIVDLDTGSRELGPGEIGELIIAGPQVMTGYWNSPDETKITIRHGWLYTGDIARMDQDGYFYIVDRKKDMAIIGGYNVYPREVEEVLYEHPKVKEAAVVGVQHRVRGEILVAHVVLQPGVTDNPRQVKKEIRDFCRQRLTDYKVPRRIEIVDEIPKTLIGKALRRAIREEESAKGAEEEDEE